MPIVGNKKSKAYGRLNTVNVSPFPFLSLVSVWSMPLRNERGLLFCLSLLSCVGWQRIEGQENPNAVDKVPKKEEKGPDEKPKKRRHNDKLG